MDISIEQLNKLIEITEKLFPEFDEIIIEKATDCYISTETDHGTLNLPDKYAPILVWLLNSKKDEFEVIPLFEFVITKLLDRLSQKLSYMGYKDYISMHARLPNIDDIIVAYEVYNMTHKNVK